MAADTEGEHIFYKDLIGVEDISFDTSRGNNTFNRYNSKGQRQAITKLNARHIPVSNLLTWGTAESVEDMLTLAKIASDNLITLTAEVAALKLRIETLEAEA